MSDLEFIVAHTQAGFSLEVNAYKNNYQPLTDALGDFENLDPEVKKGIGRTGTLVELRFYPLTPVGSYCIVDYDLTRALRRGAECIREEFGL